MQTHDPPIVSHTKLTNRLRCIPLRNSYRYWLGLGLGLSFGLGLGLSLGLCFSLVFADKDLSILESKANKYIGYIYSWLCYNKLSLNLIKTSYTIFGQHKPYIFNISLNGILIKCQNDFKFLGIIIDNKLFWKPYITLLASNLSRIVAVFYKLRNKINIKSLIVLYNALFHSRLSYCCSSWGSNYKSVVGLHNIILLQNKVHKCIYKLHQRTNINFIYKRHNILKIVDLVLIIKVTLLKNTHYAFNTVYRTKLLQKCVRCLNSCTRAKNRFIIPKCRINISCYAVQYTMYIMQVFNYGII